MKKYYEKEKEDYKTQVSLIYLHAIVTNTEKPPTLEEIYNDIEEGYKNKGKKVDKKQDPDQMLNIVKRLNAQFGGHLPK